MEGYRYLAEALKKYGVTHIFYVESMLENMLLEANKLGIATIMTHTENAAGYMADGYARASGRPGVCMAQSIGAANLAGGIYDACLANSPVIAITGKKPPMMQYTGAYQEAEHRLLYEGITKFHGEILSGKQLPHVLSCLFRHAVTGKPGPVHADLLNNLGVELEFSQVDQEVFAEEAYRSHPAFRPAADPAKIKEAADAIKRAKKPLIVAGRGVIASGAKLALQRFAKMTSIPVVTTPDGKTSIDETDPLWAGVVGGYGNACANRTASNADLVIFIGTQASDQTTNNWRMPPKNTKIIHIDIEPSELGKNYRDTIGLLGDAKVVLEQISTAADTASDGKWLQQVQAQVAVELAGLSASADASGELISPYLLCRELSRVLPDNAVLMADTGNSAIWTSTAVRMKSSQDYIRAAGSLGWGLPGSLGAKCALPDRPVICFVGDGAFYYHMSELETAARYGINTIIVINNNGGLVQVRELLDVVYEGEPAEKKERAYRFRDVDLSRIAEGLGCHAVRIQRIEEFEPAFQEALQCGRPAVIEVMTSDQYTINPMPEGPRPLYGAAAAR